MTATITRGATTPMTNPARTLSAIIGVTEQLAANLTAHIGVELALAPDVLRAASLTGGSRSSDHPDPTGTLATSLTSRGDNRTTTSSWAEFCADAETVLRVLRRMQARQAACIRQDPDVAREADATARALRCDGSIDPLCTNNAVRDGKCWKCIKRVQRGESDTVHRGHVHADVLGSGTFEPSAPQAALVVGTCGRCGCDFTGRDAEHVAILLEEHHIEGCIP